MKRVLIELVTMVEVVTPAADDEVAKLVAEDMVRLRFPGKGYAIRHVKVEDAPDGEAGLRWRRP